MKAKIIMPLIWFVLFILFVLMWVYKPFSFTTHCLLTLLWAAWTLYFLFAMFIILAFGSEEEPELNPEKESIISRVSGAFTRFLTEIGGIKEED